LHQETRRPRAWFELDELPVRLGLGHNYRALSIAPPWMEPGQSPRLAGPWVRR
jgi:hypothetical protein